MNKKQIERWYKEGQKPQKVNLGVIPTESAWSKFIIWGESSEFMPTTNRQAEEQGRTYAKEIGLM
jgi:hypothetical protein